MVGILLITHNGLGDSLLDCLRHVTGTIPAHIKSLSILADDDPVQKEEQARALIGQLDQGQGVLLLTDVFGATPSNIARRLCQPGQVEGMAGVNLPILLRLACGLDMPLHELATRTLQRGRDCIMCLNDEAENLATAS